MVLLGISGFFFGCGEDPDAGSSGTYEIDASQYFPVEVGRYWVYIDEDDRFLSVEFTHVMTLVGENVHVLTYTFDDDTTHGDSVEPAYEEYFLPEPGKGVLTHGYKDYQAGTYATYLPGVLFAGENMEIGVPVATVTSVSGQPETFTTMLVAHDTVGTYYGDFPDAIEIAIGQEGEEPLSHFLARGKGMVKFDWQGSRFELYDFGTR